MKSYLNVIVAADGLFLFDDTKNRQMSKASQIFFLM